MVGRRTGLTRAATRRGVPCRRHRYPLHRWQVIVAK